MKPHGSESAGMPERIAVQISGDPLTLRVSDAALGEWCARTHRPKTALVNAMIEKVGAIKKPLTLGAGSWVAGAQEQVWTIAAAGTLLEPVLEVAVQRGLPQ